MTQTQLSVNLNKIALIRNSRGHGFPDVREFAALALDQGAVGVTIHPRPDQRHARYEDIADLRVLVNSYTDKELNVEGYPTDILVDHVITQRPHQFTLVPDEPDQITSDHGWDLKRHGDWVRPVIERCQQSGIRTSLFVDPDPEQVRRAADTGTDRIELYTEDYAEAWKHGDHKAVLAKYMECADLARELGLTVNAGHDLDLQNLADFAAAGNVAEVSIGHALTVEALRYGFAETVRRYVTILAR
ncbi:pyridoxine 5'-phosphate synthase [Natronospirillum operosum]|uniref:Pyridoxine 5'-phosphate synthase n=1 Tax=Natronospirillum operosum TaxID=2759953 RepID=A0A4Z0W3R9_9GAMM|nr:pyridoxine 5'-phosphate synthase [Natronospirillum operosum]TGG91778.1 pyridoxine 5'-phosphate synthase [Natronospirillum operosum]